jgi:hypothetical protein
MQLVSTVTVGAGGAASITFTGIPSSATDLLILVSGRASWASAIRGQLEFQFNPNNNNHIGRGYGGYNGNLFQQNDTTPSDRFKLFNAIPAGSSTANTFGSASLYVSNYTGSQAKTASLDATMENNSSTSGLGILAGQWNGTSAITSIRISHDQENFVQHSTASLYLITKA